MGIGRIEGEEAFEVDVDVAGGGRLVFEFLPDTPGVYMPMLELSSLMLSITGTHLSNSGTK